MFSNTGQIRNQVEKLKDVADVRGAEGVPFMRRQPAEILSHNLDRAGLSLKDSGKQTKKRCLSASARSEKKHPLV